MLETARGKMDMLTLEKQTLVEKLLFTNQPYYLIHKTIQGNLRSVAFCNGS